MDALKQEALKDQEMTKYREQLLTQHSLEIEKINERHRNEMKKYHVRTKHIVSSVLAFLCIAFARGTCRVCDQL